MSAPRTDIRDEDPRSGRLRETERGVEERLARMAREGELSGLPGERRPLARDGGDAAGDRWAAFHLMTANKILPSWAQLRREIEAESEQLARRVQRHVAWTERQRAQLRRLPAERILEAARRASAHDAEVRGEITSAVDQLNAKVDRFNAVAPVAALQLLRFSVERFFEAAST